MAPRYIISADFAGDIASFAPYWVIGVVRFKNQSTFDLSTGQSVTSDDSYAMEEHELPLVTTQAVAVTAASSKESHVTNLAFTLMGEKNYLSVILPGDWVVCNMLHSDDEAKRVAGLLLGKKPVNGWLDGLKFLGRVQSVRKSVAADATTGTRTTMYSVQCAGFAEFDSALFYHPQLVKGQGLPSTMFEFGAALKDIVKFRQGSQRTMESGTVDINRVIPVLINAVFGKGFYSKSLGISGLAGGTASPNRPFLIPTTISKWLGLKATSYADLLRPFLGVQHYNTPATSTNKTVADPWLLFKPDGTVADDGFFKAGGDMVGFFAPAPPQYSTTVWNLLSTYLNSPVNEMYVTLRGDVNTGQVLPHLVVRQLPYTTDAAAVTKVLAQDAIDQELGTGREHKHREQRLAALAKTTGGKVKAGPLTPIKGAPLPVAPLDVTQFQELPRWVVDSKVLHNLDVGRSDSMRFNMVHVSGVGIGQVSDPIDSFVRAEPNIDELDIKRSGLRPYMTTTNCFYKDLRKGPTAWRDLMTDVVVGMHLMLSGSITIVGVLAPIAVGDNLEFENVVYHIEQVTHTCRIEPGGRRSFLTTLQLSHGVLEQTEREYEGRVGLYAGTHGEAAVTDLPVTEESDGT